VCPRGDLRGLLEPCRRKAPSSSKVLLPLFHQSVARDEFVKERKITVSCEESVDAVSEAGPSDARIVNDGANDARTIE